MDTGEGGGGAYGRARGRARGTIRRPVAPEGGPRSPQDVAGLSPPQRVSPPGRQIEPRMGDLSLDDMRAAALADLGQLTRYGNGGGRGNNGGNGNGNGNGGNGGNGGRHPPVEDMEIPGREGEWQLARANVVDRATERYDYINTSKAIGTTKVGAAGTIIQCYVNYFSVRTGEQWCMYHYRVDFEPAVDETRMRRMLMKGFRGTPDFGNFIFDGHSLWKTVQIPEPHIRHVTADDGTNYQVFLKLVATIPPGDPQFLQLYNNVTRACLRILRLCAMGRNYFDPTAEVTMPTYRIKLWPGFVTTMRQHDAGLLYCVELTNKVIRTDSVWTIMKQTRQEATAAGRDFKVAVEQEVIGSVALTMYNNKTYKIDGIAWDETPQSTFLNKDNIPVQFMDYYKRYSSHGITALNQPLLVSNPTRRDIRIGNNQPIKLIPELCQMTGLTQRMRANFRMMTDMGQHLFQAPQTKIDNTVAFMKRLTSNPEAMQELTGWGMEMKFTPMTVNARLLPPEQVLLQDKRNRDLKVGIPIEMGDFTKGFRGPGNMISSVPLTNWVMILQARDNGGLDNLIVTMMKVASNLGFSISRPTETTLLNSGAPHHYARAITDAQNKHRGLQLVFVILMNNSIETYSTVKKKCYIDYALPSQCFLSRNVGSRQLMSIATKVAIQINAKLGGECWGIHIPMKALMIVGFDVHHGGVGSKGGSIGAMVATTGADYMTYFSTASVFNSREELSTTMARDMQKCITAYRTVNNGLLPDRIMFYRDGVGDGQLTYVYNTELEALKECYTELYARDGREPPKFTMIICTKRINTRIFERTANRKCENPKPGTVLDTAVTLPHRWDFFLIAQVARQGTVSPTNYNVIYDTNALDADKMQRLTYKFCNLYYNWSGGVAVPAVVQYAHKMAFLTGTALGQPGHDRLGHLLYYL